MNHLPLLNLCGSADTSTSADRPSRCRRYGLHGRQRVAQVLRQTSNGGDVRGDDADSRFGLDAGAQFEVAQRVKAVLGQRTVRVDGATQDQADLLGDQTPEPAGPLVRGQRVQLGAEFACVRSALPRRIGTASANRLRCANAVNHGVSMIGAYPVYARSWRSSASNA